MKLQNFLLVILSSVQLANCAPNKAASSPAVYDNDEARMMVQKNSSIHQINVLLEELLVLLNKHNDVIEKDVKEIIIQTELRKKNVTSADDGELQDKALFPSNQVQDEPLESKDMPTKDNLAYNATNIVVSKVPVEQCSNDDCPTPPEKFPAFDDECFECSDYGDVECDYYDCEYVKDEEPSQKTKRVVSNQLDQSEISSKLKNAFVDKLKAVPMSSLPHDELPNNSNIDQLDIKVLNSLNTRADSYEDRVSNREPRSVHFNPENDLYPEYYEDEEEEIEYQILDGSNASQNESDLTVKRARRNVTFCCYLDKDDCFYKDYDDPDIIYCYKDKEQCTYDNDMPTVNKNNVTPQKENKAQKGGDATSPTAQGNKKETTVETENGTADGTTNENKNGTTNENTNENKGGTTNENTNENKGGTTERPTNGSLVGTAPNTQDNNAKSTEKDVDTSLQDCELDNLDEMEEIESVLGKEVCKIQTQLMQLQLKLSGLFNIDVRMKNILKSVLEKWKQTYPEVTISKEAFDNLLRRVWCACMGMSTTNTVTSQKRTDKE